MLSPTFCLLKTELAMKYRIMSKSHRTLPILDILHWIYIVLDKLFGNIKNMFEVRLYNNDLIRETIRESTAKLILKNISLWSLCNVKYFKWPVAVENDVQFVFNFVIIRLYIRRSTKLSLKIEEISDFFCYGNKNNCPRILGKKTSS